MWDLSIELGIRLGAKPLHSLSYLTSPKIWLLFLFSCFIICVYVCVYLSVCHMCANAEEGQKRTLNTPGADVIGGWVGNKAWVLQKTRRYSELQSHLSSLRQLSNTTPTC